MSGKKYWRIVAPIRKADVKPNESINNDKAPITATTYFAVKLLMGDLYHNVQNLKFF